MQLEGYVQALREDLSALATLGDENTERAAQLLAVALESSFGRRLLEALTEASLELADQLDGVRVEVRLAGSDPQLVVVPEDADPSTAGASDEANTARITLRLPDSVKSRVESAAARDGVSANTWIVNVLSRGSEPRRPSAGRRLSGYGQS